MRRNRTTIYKSVDELVHETAYANMDNMSIDQLADELNISRHILYRMINPHDSKANFPAKLLNNLMRIKNDYQILQSLAHCNGFLLVKKPKGTLKSMDEKVLVTEFQCTFNDIMKQLLLFFQYPDENKRASLINNITNYMEKTAQIREIVKQDDRQFDLFQEEA